VAEVIGWQLCSNAAKDLAAADEFFVINFREQ
jgi:hypothetical protein